MQNSTKDKVVLRQALQVHAPAVPQFEGLTSLNGVLQPYPENFQAEARFGSNPGVAENASLSRLFYRRVGKRVLDVTLVLVTLPLTTFIIGVFAVALWIEGGNPFYRQNRLGQNGRVFRMYKLRTMSANAEEILDVLLASNSALHAEWSFTQKLKEDPRITPVGKFLRCASIDELPQVWNVLIGNMSLVGPRPMMPDQLDLYGDARSYKALKPGLTGFWQVRERNESHFSYRAQVDRTYDEQASFWVDLSVLWKTIGVVLRRTGY